MREIVRLAIETETIGLLEFHEVYGVTSERYEYDFQNKDIEWFPAKEKIDVTGEEDNQKDFLSAVGQTCINHLLPMTFLLAIILRSSMSTAIRCRKSPMNWKMSIFHVLLLYFNSSTFIKI